MDHYKIYRVTARSFEGRIPLQHEFSMPGKDEQDVIEAVQTRWPQLYNIEVHKR